MKRILITGAGSGFGEGVALGLAQQGHEVIATTQIWPQVTKLQEKADALGITNMRIEKIDILDPYDVDTAAKWDIDILVNNAAIGFTGPIAEIPIDLVQTNFETNVFATLNFTQQFIRNFVDEKRAGKIVFISSIAGLLSAPGYGSYCATKHALEALAESLYIELQPFNIQVQTINPGAFKTGFNEGMAKTASHWMNDDENFIKESETEKMFSYILDQQMDPQIAINAMIEIIPADAGKFRNVIPQVAELLIKKIQKDAWDRMM